MRLAFLVVAASVAVGCCGWWQLDFPVLWYRVSTSLTAIWALYTLPEEHVKSFIDSYSLFGLDRVTGDNDEAQKTVNYYQVINHLCAVWEVEKMYIPPVLDSNAGVFGNQMLWEEKGMADKLDIGPTSLVLDMGCGRGSVAHHVASHTGAKVVGVNIDPSQIATATSHAEQTGLLGKQLNFVHGNFNDRLPFEDQVFDAIYEVQVLTYTVDPVKLFQEWYRVLKPGAKASILDYVLLDNFDYKNPDHVAMLPKSKALLGAVWDPKPVDLTNALEKAGFKIVSSEQASKTPDGTQAVLFEKADGFFVPFTKFLHFLVSIRVIPEHFKTLFDRLTKDADAYVNGDKDKLWTTSWQIIVQKPLA